MQKLISWNKIISRVNSVKELLCLLLLFGDCDILYGVIVLRWVF
jgi:hypothetical protein